MRGMQYCSCCLWLLQSHSFKQRDFGTSAVWQQVPATCQTSMVIFFWCQEQSSDEYVSVMRRSHKYSFSSCWYLGSSEGWLKQMCTELGCSWVPRCSSAACHCLHSRTAGELEFILLSFQGPHQNYFFWGSSCTDTTWVELCSAQRVCQVAEQGPHQSSSCDPQHGICTHTLQDVLSGIDTGCVPNSSCICCTQGCGICPAYVVTDTRSGQQCCATTGQRLGRSSQMCRVFK